MTGIDTFTGSSLLATGTTFALSGTVTGVGSTITLTETTAQSLKTVSTATYDGYYTVSGNTYYVFSSVLATGGSFVVSSTGAVLTSSTAVQHVTEGLPTATCFLSGTLIAGPDGEIAVERLQPGDLVATSGRDGISFSPVRWIGRGRMQAGMDGLHVDDAPVRVKAGALDDALPARDLLVTPEHCLLFDGVLIPARMLVNNGSITSDVAHGAFDFFHVELDRHAILLANGVEVESYLDTGNRANFHNNDVAALHSEFALPEPRSWPVDAAAPLAVDRDTVEPIWNRLADRARTLGFTTVAATTAAVVDADLELRIVTDAGQEILPTLADDRVYAFIVPAGSGTLRLRSRSARPSDTVGPFLDDRRMLGVQIGRISVGGTGQHGMTTAHLTTDRLPGWHDAEAEAGRTCRWTDGDAMLPIGATANTDHPMLLDIEIVGVGPYRAIAQVA